MSTTQTTAATTPNLGNLALLAKKSERALDRDLVDLAFRINHVLQTTLELEALLALYSEELASVVPHHGVIYTLPDSSYTVNQGHKAKHSCAYDLDAGEYPLGKLSITRRTPFSEQELATIEYLLCCLVYPLRNALLYKRAVETASKDPLTGSQNRASYDAALNREISLATRHNTPFAMIIVDIDHFKCVNDTYGHLVGDNIIKSVAASIDSCIRDSDMVFRYGGEEFVVLLSNTHNKGAHSLAERIRKRIEKSNPVLNGEKIQVTASLGVASLCDNDDGHSLFERADKALYQAKHEGRNCVRISAPESPALDLIITAPQVS